MTRGNRHSMDGEIRAGDAVVSRVNGTGDLYVVATVQSAVGDLILHGVSTMTGQDAAIACAHQQRSNDQNVWFFGGSAGAYVKAREA